MKLKNRVPEIPGPPIPWGEIKRAWDHGNPQLLGEAFPLPPPMRVETKPSWPVFIGVCSVPGLVALVAIGLPLLAAYHR